MQKVSPAIETHLRVSRQIDRFGQLEIKANRPSPGIQTADPRACSRSSEVQRKGCPRWIGVLTV
jgi:hypothetical protein